MASVLALAQAKNLQPKLLLYKNSGEVTGDQTTVVGYGAFGFFENDSNKKYSNEELQEANEKKELYAYNHLNHNCVFKLHKKRKINIITTEDINENQELFISYGFMYWILKISNISKIE